jgi:uncharacterized protein YbjT (DUF2867 family)
MKIVLIGGTGLIGSRLGERLRAAGHEAVAASPATGVDTLTGQGLAEVLTGADVVVDVSNSPSFEDVAVLDFFQTSGKNLLAAEEAAGVGHHLAVSIVGADRLPDSGYLRAKLVQEALVEASTVPFTILRSTQFFEFLGAIVAGGTDGGEIRLPDALLQCVAADDVADTLADLAVGEPVRGRVELGGPEALPFAVFAERWLANRGDDRRVTADPHARYFGTELQTSSLVAGPGARRGRVHLADWLATRAAHR